MTNKIYVSVLDSELQTIICAMEDANSLLESSIGYDGLLDNALDIAKARLHVAKSASPAIIESRAARTRSMARCYEIHRMHKDGMTLKAIGERLGLSSSRVSQLRDRAARDIAYNAAKAEMEARRKNERPNTTDN